MYMNLENCNMKIGDIDKIYDCGVGKSDGGASVNRCVFVHMKGEYGIRRYAYTASWRLEKHMFNTYGIPINAAEFLSWMDFYNTHCRKIITKDIEAYIKKINDEIKVMVL